MDLALILNQEITQAAKRAVSELYQPARMFARLPEICTVSDLAQYYGVSNDVVSKMIRDGLPHTHAGREYRFHKALLEEWTRNGEKPYLCEKCARPEEKTESKSNVITPVFERGTAAELEERFAKTAKGN